MRMVNLLVLRIVVRNYGSFRECELWEKEKYSFYASRFYFFV